jgi:hypothetical protein
MSDTMNEPAVNSDEFTFGDALPALSEITFTINGVVHRGALRQTCNHFSGETTIYFHTRKALYPVKRRHNGTLHRQRARLVETVRAFPVVGDITHTWRTD